MAAASQIPLYIPDQLRHCVRIFVLYQLHDRTCKHRSLTGRRAKTAVSHRIRLVIVRYKIFGEYPLTKAVALVYLNSFTFIRIVRYFAEDMPLIVAAVVIAVYDPHGIVQLEAEFEAEAAPRIQLQNVSVVDLSAYPRRYFYGFSGP